MKIFRVVLSGEPQGIRADKLLQDKEFVSFYVKGEVVALVRLGSGDSIVEERKLDAETP